MKVSLIDHTGKGMGARYAADLLCFTKNTRLNMSANGLQTFHDMSDEQIEDELAYMADTIPSSWEFVDYTFMIENCDRGFTHQLVRTRQGSYAQQTMRILDVSGFGYNTGPSIERDTALEAIYEDCMDYIDGVYQQLIRNGADIQDARGVLPTNIHTNIVCKFNLRTLAELISKRSSSRTQDLYRQFIQALRECVLEVHPWAHVFLRNRKHDAATMLENMIREQFSDDLDYATRLIKQVDILRG